MELRSSVERSARSGVILLRRQLRWPTLGYFRQGTNEAAGRACSRRISARIRACPSFAAMALRKWALRGVVAGGAGYAAYSFLKPVDAEHDFTGAAKKKRVGARDGPRPKLKREASSSRII